MKHYKLLQENEVIKHMVFEMYSQAVQRQADSFVELYQNTLASIFANPWVFLKRSSISLGGDNLDDVMLPSYINCFHFFMSHINIKFVGCNSPISFLFCRLSSIFRFKINIKNNYLKQVWRYERAHPPRGWQSIRRRNDFVPVDGIYFFATTRSKRF